MRPYHVYAEESARIREIHFYNASSCSKLAPTERKV
jgi:hypothetical protein